MSLILTGEQAELAASPSKGYELWVLEGTHLSPCQLSRWTLGDGTPTTPSSAPALLCSNQAASGPFLPEDLSGLTYTEVTGKYGERPQMAALWPRDFVHPIPPDWSDAGLKVPVQTGQEKGGQYSCTWIPPCTWGLTKHPGKKSNQSPNHIPTPKFCGQSSAPHLGGPRRSRGYPANPKIPLQWVWAVRAHRPLGARNQAGSWPGPDAGCLARPPPCSRPTCPHLPPRRPTAPAGASEGPSPPAAK